MSYFIKIASSQEERTNIYRFRYKVYMEEMNKRHIAADHINKMLFDEADARTLLYYADDGENVIATVRSKRGKEDFFNKEEHNLFRIPAFRKIFGQQALSITDRLIVDASYRRSRLANDIMVRTYLGGLEGGVRICFITCDERLMPMYARYGFRVYAEPVFISSVEKRYRMILLLCDRSHLQKAGSPFTSFLPEDLDDGGEYARIVEEKLGFQLNKELPMGA